MVRKPALLICRTHSNSKAGPPAYSVRKRISHSYWNGEEESTQGGVAAWAEDGDKHEGATFVASLRAYAKNKDLCRGVELHDDISKLGLLEKCSDALITMYAKCGVLRTAEKFLDTHKSSNLHTWTALISAYAQQGKGHDALNCFERMQQAGLSPDAVTYACILKACASMGAAYKGEEVHDDILRQGLLKKDVILGTALVDMYAKCGSLKKAQKVLEELPIRDVFCWNTLISGYAQWGQAEQALKCFKQMQHDSISPNAVTFSCILIACGSLGATDKGEKIHYEIIRHGLLSNDIILGNALVDMYAKCGALAKAQKVLEELPVRDVVSWSALIIGYAQQGRGEQALNCYDKMKREGLCANEVTFSSILKACGNVGAIDMGEKIHDEIVKQCLLTDNIVIGNALVDMYVKCGALLKAQQVLEELPVRNVISWSALIVGYAQQGQGEQALSCLELMQREGLSPNAVTFSCILKACSSIGALDKGENVHDEIVRQGLLKSNVMLGTALVDMYAKCGVLTKAQQVLEELPLRDSVSWSALITGYAQQGQGQKALNCFGRMQNEGVSPDAAVFSCVLGACSLSGLEGDAQTYLDTMGRNYGMIPNLDHITSMVDLFGRSGHLNKALAVIEKMPSFCSSVWSALLGACHKWEDVNIGRWAFERAIQEDVSYASAYVLMASIYTAAGMQGNAQSIEALRIKNRAWKNPAQSWWMEMS